MVNWLFKKPGSVAPAPRVAPAPPSVPRKTGPTPQQKAEAKALQQDAARAEWGPRLQAALGDDAALLRVAHDAPVIEVKLGAVQGLTGEDALKQAEREFRSHDRRVHRAAKQRLDAAVAQRESRAQAQIIIDAARALSAETPIAANRLVALDRAWQVLKAETLEPQQCSEFAQWRERLNEAVRERGEQEQQVQRWVEQAKPALAQLQRLLALPGSADDVAALREGSATAQLLRDSRIDALPTATLDQALQTALESAEQIQTRWAEPAPPEPELQVPIALPAPAPAPPRSLNPEQRAGLETLLQQAEAALAEGQLGAMQEQLDVIDALLDSFHGIRPGEALSSRVQALHAESGRLKGWQQWGGGRARDDLVTQAEALARFTEAASPRSETPAAPLEATAPTVQLETMTTPAAQPEALPAPEAHAEAASAPAAQEAAQVAPETSARAPGGRAPERQRAPPKLRLKAHADAIQDLRRRWKELDRLGAPANQTLWKRFDAALHIAHEPVAAQLAVLKAQRQANLAAREALLSELESLPAAPRSEDSAALAASANPSEEDRRDPPAMAHSEPGEVIAAFWKEQARALENFQRAWRPLGPLEHTVPSGARQALQQRLARGVERIEAPLQAARAAAEGVRRQLIERAEGLVEECKLQPQLRDAIPRVRELQAEWQHSARQLTLLRGVESALWSRFKAATDAVFTQRDAAANARDTELSANLATREALLQRLEALSSTTPAREIERTLADVDREWRIAGEPPRGTLNALETRLQKAHAAALRALSASGQVAWHALCDNVASRLALCEAAEAAPEVAPEEPPDATANPAPDLVSDLAQRWAAQDALDDDSALGAKLPASWQQALAQRWAKTPQPAPPTAAAFDEMLTHLEASLDLPATPERLAARRALKLRALKDTMEGRGAPAVDAAKRAAWWALLLRSRCADAALRERLHALLAALRAAPSGALLPTGKP